jgi:hypothetical protein
VPLSSVYRIRGSATAAALQASRMKSSGLQQQGGNQRQSLEIKVGDERTWYVLESAGGEDPPKGRGYAGFWDRMSARLRGKTDWEGEQPLAGSKQGWFADRRTFDDVIPLVKRK